MKKIIAIVLMLCLMISTCFASSNGFKDSFVYIMNNMDNINSKLYYSYTDYDDINTMNSVLIMYYDSNNTISIGIGEKGGYTYWYNCYNLAGAIVNTSCTVIALRDVLGYNISSIDFSDTSLSLNRMISAYDYATERVINSYGGYTTFEDFAVFCVEYGCGNNALSRITYELNNISV